MFWCITILLTITNQQELFYSAFTNETLTDTENWSITTSDPPNVIQYCGTHSIVGGYQKFGVGAVANNFLKLPPHFIMKITFTLFIIDSWDEYEYFSVYVDEILQYNKAYSYKDSQTNICGQSGYPRNDSIYEIELIFEHNGLTTFFELTSTLNQEPEDESWGFRNFRLFLYLCPSGCLTCSSSNFQGECQTWIIAGSFFTTMEYSTFSSEGWTILSGSQLKQQCSIIPSICGYNVCGQNTQLKFTLGQIPFHNRMKIKFKYLKIDGWESSDYAILQVDSSPKWKSRLSEFNQYYNGVCGGPSKDVFINVELTFPHQQTTTTIMILNTLDESYTDESFGVRDIEIFIQQSVCGDTIIQENEECDDGNMDPFDGCFNCVFSCVDGCQLCHKGTCLRCYSQWQYLWYTNTCQRISINTISSQNLPIAFSEPICYKYIEGCLKCLDSTCIQCQNGYDLQKEGKICKSICGDNITTMDEECDGQNCNNCRFECPNFCTECYFGICYLCQTEYNLQDNQCIREQTYSLSQISLCEPLCEVCIESVCYKCQIGYRLILGYCQEICGDNDLAIYSLDECVCDPMCAECKFASCYSCSGNYQLINNTCVSKCGDLILQENEECEDGNEIEFDGCFNCQFSCPLNCKLCQQGICLDTCQYGYYLINNVCQTTCGDMIVAGQEQCEDNNNINNDGCYQCQYSCPLNCQDCENGECFSCNPGFTLFENTCTNICGDNVISYLEQCDDGNLVDGDGCSQFCQVELNWICNLSTDCTYVKYPTVITEYLMQQNQYQYVKITFSQPVQQYSNQNYSDTIQSKIVDLSESLFNITIMEVQPALYLQTSDVQYIFQIEILSTLNYNPIFEIILTEQLYNDNQAPLSYQIDYIQLKQPNYITQEQKKIAGAFQQINEASVKSLCFLTVLLMLLGNFISFWSILDALQEQSYLKYINVLYPQTLIIYFDSSQVVSTQQALNYISLYKNEVSFLQFPYLQSYEKFSFYEVNADIAQGLRAEIVLFATLYAVYLGTLFLQNALATIETFQFLQQWPRFVRYIQKLKRKINYKRKEAKATSLQNTLRACSWDLLFMALLQLKAPQNFENLRAIICVLIAISILITTLIILISQVQGLLQWKKQNFYQFWEQKRDIFKIGKKFLILYILVFYQYEQELQTLILTLVNFLYLFYIIYFKQQEFDSLEYFKSIIMETSLTLFTGSTLLNWNFISNYLTYSYKIVISWIQICILVSVLIIFVFIELYNTYRVMKQKISAILAKRNSIIKDNENYNDNTFNQVKIVDQNQEVKNSQENLKQSQTIFSRSNYVSLIQRNYF